MQTLKDFYIPEKVDFIPVLDQLPLVSRFSMTVMFLSSSDKKVIAELVDHAQFQQYKGQSDKLQKIKKQFQL